MPAHDNARLWANRDCLDVQYRTDANLVARQSIYAYQRPRLDLHSAVLEAASLAAADVGYCLAAGETVTDVGCGNGLTANAAGRAGLPELG